MARPCEAWARCPPLQVVILNYIVRQLWNMQNGERIGDIGGADEAGGRSIE